MALFENFFSRLFQDKPEIPALQSIDLGEQQRQTTKSNIAALPGLEQLSTEVNRFSQEQLLKNLRGLVPDLDQILGQQSKNLLAASRGELAPDARDLLQNRAAARALGSTGSSLYESGYGRSLAARDLGIASQDLIDRSLSATESWLAASRGLLGPQLDFSSMFITPAQQAGFAQSERNTRWNYDWFVNQQEAQLSPWADALADLGDNILNLAASYFGGPGALMGSGPGASAFSGFDPGSARALGSGRGSGASIDWFPASGSRLT